MDQGEKNVFKDLLSFGMELGSVKPAKLQKWQYYSCLHYEEHVKGLFETAWKVEVQRAQDLGLPSPHDVKVRGEVTR